MKMSFMFTFAPTCYKYVNDVGVQEVETSEDFIDESLKGLSCIPKTERYS